MIFRADRGGQYTSKHFGAHGTTLGIGQSVGRVGSCHENSRAESFCATLERELVSHFRFQTRAQAGQAMTAWIVHDNTTEPRSSLGSVSASEWELSYCLTQLHAA